MSARALIRSTVAIALWAAIPALVLGCPAPQEEAPAVEAPAPEVPEAPAEPVLVDKEASLFVAWSSLDDECREEHKGDKCVVVDPKAYIWKDGKPKYAQYPKKVAWSVGEKEHHWEFEYKGPEGGDYLGKIKAIECGSEGPVKSKKVSKDVKEGEDLTWPYRITVYACKDGKQDKCLCKTDPEVIIKD